MFTTTKFTELMNLLKSRNLVAFLNFKNPHLRITICVQPASKYFRYKILPNEANDTTINRIMNFILQREFLRGAAWSDKSHEGFIGLNNFSKYDEVVPILNEWANVNKNNEWASVNKN